MSRIVRSLVLVAVLCLTCQVNAAILSFDLSDHPDGNQNPPPYGLRYDGIFGSFGGAVGGVASFSFNAAQTDVTKTNMTLAIDTTAGSITISGDVYGGEDAGSVYGFGEGWYTIAYTYSANVLQVANGWKVTAFDGANSGTISSQGNADVGSGWSQTFYDQSTPSFLFLQDDHRLAGTGLEGTGLWVGRGWVTSNSNGSNTSATQDWLFTGVPTPGVGGLFGLAGLGMIRRRR
jgi:MYXO-CTERM domain-containing protein